MAKSPEKGQCFSSEKTVMKKGQCYNRTYGPPADWYSMVKLFEGGDPPWVLLDVAVWPQPAAWRRRGGIEHFFWEKPSCDVCGSCLVVVIKGSHHIFARKKYILLHFLQAMCVCVRVYFIFVLKQRSPLIKLLKSHFTL